MNQPLHAVIWRFIRWKSQKLSVLISRAGQSLKSARKFFWNCSPIVVAGNKFQTCFLFLGGLYEDASLLNTDSRKQQDILHYLINGETYVKTFKIPELNKVRERI